MRWQSCLYLATLLGFISSAAAAETPAGLRCPAGFTVSQYADETLVPDAVRLALDPQGRLVVSGPGYIRVLVDDDQNGQAERASEFSNEPRTGAMGMLWEGDSLYFIGQGGLRRLCDADHDGRADGPSELLRAVRASGEHDAHALRRGPDGWLYLLCGNNAGIDASWAQLPTSPIKTPVAGCVVRFTPDLTASEIVADGFRNAYGMDFNDDGELFTYDSDNERCVSLPWYEPTRFYHVVPGGHHGWLSPQRAAFWRLPSYAADVVMPVTTLGRGSPTGVACYRGSQFPASYRGGFFVLDWTFGRVDFLALERAGSSYTARREPFLETIGENGFAPTDVLVHPETGDLFVSIGGRGTRGAVYRVRYVGKGDRPNAVGMPTAHDRPAWIDLDWQPGCERACLTDASGADAFVRRRAIAYLLRHRTRFSEEMVGNVVLANWASTDRLLRAEAAELIVGLDARQRIKLRHEARTALARATWAMGAATTEPAEALRCAASVVADSAADADARLVAVRAIQRAWGDLVAPALMNTVWEGYSRRDDESQPDVAAQTAALTALRAAFSAADAELGRELARTLAVIEDGDPMLRLRVAERLTETSDPLDDIHYLAVLARLTGPRSAEVTSLSARTLIRLDAKLDRQHARRDLHFPLRVSEIHAELARRDLELNRALIDDSEFGRPAHALYAEAPGFDRRRAAERILANLDRESDDEDEASAWNAALVALVGDLPQERSLPVLRRLWGRVGLDDAIVGVLARHPQEADRQRFVAGLGSPQHSIVSLSIDALEKLPRQDNEELLALVRALGRFAQAPEHEAVRNEIVAALRRITGETSIEARSQAWEEWLTRSHPDLAARLGGADGVDLPSWRRRLAAIDWSAGDAARGRKVFQQASCAACHSAGQALGPDLSGAAGRFSREDIFTAILQPSRDISSRYRTVAIATADGKVHQGMLIYDAVDGVILQTGAATAVRLAGDQITVRRPGSISLMPAGLLDKLRDDDIADLYAYLKSLARDARPGESR
jgi:putative membrane-bound dehydrogenase-like protein